MSSARDDEAAGEKPDPSPRGRPFKPGRSGNPNGRPRGSKGTGTLLRRELGERVAVRDRGRIRKLTKREILIKRLVEKALEGSLRHIAFIHALDPLTATALEEARSQLGQPADDLVKADVLRRLREAGLMGGRTGPTDKPDEESSGL